MSKFYLGTVLLEKNRWSSRIPTFLVSDWTDRIAADGFDGIELWENHVLRAEGELAKLADAQLPIAVYNMYADFSNAEADKLAKSLEAIRTLKPRGIKFNIGADAARLPEYRKNMLSFADALPAGCVMLCEWHPGTVIEDVDAAGAFFAGLPTDKFQVITHAFSYDADSLQKQFDVFGKRITLVHVQRVLNDKRVRLDADAAHVRACCKVLADNGYTGDFTLEFTEGTSAPDESIDMLYANALLDLAFLKEVTAK